MKKSLIALAALSAFTTAAQAQSSVTVYGVMDLGYGAKEYTNNSYNAVSDGKVTGTQQGSLASQRLGFKGTEDLGGGLKANFTLELGFRSSGTQLDTDAGKERTTTVGLESASLGRLDIGWDKTASQLIMEKYTAGGANNFVGEAFNFKDETDFGGTKPNTAWQRPVDEFTDDRATGFHYKSPRFSGVQVGLTYANSDSNDTADGTVSANAKNTLQDISVVYEGIKGLSVGISQGKEKVRAAGAIVTSDEKVTQYGASYAVGPATLFGQFVQSETTGTNGAQSRSLDGQQFGVRYAVTPVITLHAQMANLDEESTAGTKTYDRKAQQFGAQYALSKRTTAYVLVGSTESKKLSDGVVNEVKGYAAGVRHSF